MSWQFNEENENKFHALLERYPKKSSLTLPSLWMVQHQDGWVSEDAMKYLANKLDTSAMDIYSIASFYSMFHLKPIGKYNIQICKTLSCKLRGSEDIKKYIEDKLGIKVGETSNDMKFSINEVECLGSCGTAPCVCINEDYIQNSTPEILDEIINGLK